MCMKICIDGEFSKDFTPTLTLPHQGGGDSIVPYFRGNDGNKTVARLEIQVW